MNCAIVVIGFNRINSTRRLMDSISKANYEGDNVDLIFSIDYSGNDEIENYAKDFRWEHGNKRIVAHKNRLGLRKHVLKCGDFVFDYDGIAVFEDDLFVAPSFYSYMKRAIQFYKDDLRIAGISLYTHLWNESAQRPFAAEKTLYDSYFIQYAQSWGQIWMPKQWNQFKEWYEKNSNSLIINNSIPRRVSQWGETSWLKYHIIYCIEMNKFFVYPYYSYSTNFVEVGQHCKTSNRIYQVPLAYSSSADYRFAEFDSIEAPHYDAFFERIISPEALELNEEILVDLYGEKTWQGERYYLTTRKLDFKIVREYGLFLRPQEMNVLLDVRGNDIFLYDTYETVKTNKRRRFDITRWDYESRVFDYRYITEVLIDRVKKRVFRKL